MSAGWFSFSEVGLQSPRAIEATALIPEDSLFFCGHFPARPVVPGLAMLGIVEALLTGDSVAPSREVHGFRRVRFRSLIESQATLGVSLFPVEGRPDGEFLFKLRSGDEVCCEGLAVAPRRDVRPAFEPGPSPFQPVDYEAPALGLELEELIPHRERMRVVGDLLSVEEGRATSRSVVDQTWPLAGAAEVSSATLIELAAQTASALIGWERRHEEAVGGQGFLVGVRKALWNRPKLSFGEPLLVSVETARKRDNYAAFSVTAGSPSGLAAVVELQAFRA